jgi:hypothetical protein
MTARSTSKAVVAVVPQARFQAVAAADGPYDGALTIDNAAGFVALMDALGEGGAPARIAAALATSPGAGPSGRVAIDRKLLDYARYQGSRSARWRAAVRAFRPVGAISGSPGSDKGRFAASTVPLDDVGSDEDVGRIVRDVNECALLGIPWLDLRRSDGAAPPPDLWAGLLETLARLRADTPGLDPDVGGVRLRVDPSDVQVLDVGVARRAGVAAVDLGLIDPSVAPAAMDAARIARAAGWVTTAEIAIGAGDPDVERSVVLQLERAGLAIQGRAGAHLADADVSTPDTLNAALGRLRDPDARLAQALELARAVDAKADETARLVRPRRPSLRSFLRRVLR